MAISQVNHLGLYIPLSKHCQTAAAGLCDLFCQASYNLMTPPHKLLSVLQQNLMSELNNREMPRSCIRPNRSIASSSPLRYTDVWTGVDKTRSLIRAARAVGAVCFPS